MRIETHVRLGVALSFVLFITAGLPAQATAAVPGVDELRSRIEALESSSQLQDEARAQALEFYRSAIADAEANARYAAQARDFARTATEAPALTARWERKAGTLGTERFAVPESLETLSQSLVEEQRDLADQQSKLAAVQNSIASESDVDLSQMLVDVQMTIAQSLPPAVGAQEPLVVSEASAIANAVRHQSLLSKADMLQQRLLSRDSRLTLLTAERQYLTLLIDTLTDRVARLQSRVNEVRRRVAGRTARRAEALVTRLEDHPRWVREIAASNAALASQIAEVTQRIDRLTSSRQKLADQLAQIERYHDNLRRQLAVTGAEQSAELGRAMVRQHRRLDQTFGEPRNKELEREITSARLRQLELEDQRLLDAAGSGADGSASSRSPELAQDLWQERIELLDEGVAAYRRYITETTGLLSDEKALHVATANYQSLLDRRLFWIPSAEAFSKEVGNALYQELRWFVDRVRAIEPANEIERLAQNPGQSSLLVLLVLASLLTRRYFLRSPTLANSIAATLVISAPVPVFLCALAYFLGTGDELWSAIVSGLRSTALVLFALLVFNDVCRPNGHAQLKFHWSHRTLKTLRTQLPKISVLLLAVTPLIAVGEAAGEVVGTSEFSRLVFSVGLLASVMLSYQTARCATGREAFGQSSWWTVLFALSVIVPLVLVGLSLSGYHFTAMEIARRLLLSACLIGTTVVLFYVALGAISAVEHRIARAIARGQQNDAAKGGLHTHELDMVGVQKQARSTLRLVFVALAGIFAWQFWSDMLPALSVVDDVTLWTAGSTDSPVTLAHALQAALVAFLTFFSCRNLPGALEVSLLARLDLEPGANFAIMTITKYLCGFTGVFAVISLLGADWSQLQWLIAALGVGLGFGLQEVVANFVSGILILFERPIRVGDTITVGTTTGTVSRIRIRSTTLTDYDRKEHVLPNKMVINERLTNWTLRDSITRVVIEVCVINGSDLVEVDQVLRRVALANPRVCSEPAPATVFIGFGESGHEFELRVFTKHLADRVPLTHELHSAIQAEFTKLGIEIPFRASDLPAGSISPVVERRPPRRAEPLLGTPAIREPAR